MINLKDKFTLPFTIKELFKMIDQFLKLKAFKK